MRARHPSRATTRRRAAPGPEPERPERPAPLWLRLSPLYITILALAAHGAALGFDFIGFDDTSIIKQRFFIIGHPSNLGLAFTTDAFLGTTGSFYRPLQTVSFMFDAVLGGQRPFVYHLTNLLLHVGSCLSLFWMLATLRYPRRAALVLASIYAVHPAFVSAVAWVPSRGDQMLTLFGLLSFTLFVRSVRSGGWGPTLLHGLTLLLALLSKETAIVIPILCLLYLYAMGRPDAPRRSLRPYVVQWAAAVGIWAVLRSSLKSAGLRGENFGARPLLENFRMIPETAGKFLVPAHFRLIPQYNLADTAIGIVSLAGLAVLIARTRGGFNRRILLGLAWFAMTLAPVMSFRNAEAPWMFDYLYHRSYLTDVGLVLVLAEISRRVSLRGVRPVAAAAAIALVVLYCAATTLAEARYYRDTLGFYAEAIARSPRSAMCYNNRAVFLGNEQNDQRAALRDFSKALEIYPAYAVAVSNRGITYQKLGDHRLALADLENAVRLQPQDPDAIYRRAGMRYAMNDYEGALEDYQRVLGVNKLYPRIYSAEAGCLAMVGRGQEALTVAEEAIRTDPKDEEAYNSRGLARRALGAAPGAIEDFTAALRIKDDYSRPYNNRGAVYFGLGDLQRAIDDFTAAIQRDSAYAEAYSNRGSTEHRLNRPQAALVDLDTALRINPDFADAYLNRGVVKNVLRMFEPAIEDFNRSLELKPGQGGAYLGRGIAKHYLNDRVGSCEDLRQAVALQSPEASGLVAEFCK